MVFLFLARCFQQIILMKQQQNKLVHFIKNLHQYNFSNEHFWQHTLHLISNSLELKVSFFKIF